MMDGADPPGVLFLEDFTPGRRFSSGTARVEAEAARRFGDEFDPRTLFTPPGSVAAPQVSAWHVAGLTMRLLVQSDLRPFGGILGAGVDELRWPAPAVAGDVLHTESEVLSSKVSRSRPEQGVVKLRTETLTEDGRPVQVLVANLIVPVRPPQSS